MHKKFAKDGLVIVTVHLGLGIDKELGPGGVEKLTVPFLKKVEAEFTNLILDEPEAVWMSRLETGAVPTLFLFNRENRIAEKFIDMEDPAAFEKQIQDLLKQP
ncbi:MAG: hypothetical protein EXR99_14520 [Gemmataceae bacterium]|nr:hypothetical protein [Gemmataceae bacterium]